MHSPGTTAVLEAAGFEAEVARAAVITSTDPVAMRAGTPPVPVARPAGAAPIPRSAGPGPAAAAAMPSPVAMSGLPSGQDLPCMDDPELFFAESPEDAGAVERSEPWGVWGGELFLRGEIVPRKRPRGRPRKTDVAA